MTIVRFYGMRHGHRLNGGDELSPLGFRQVEASAIANLDGVQFHASYYSGLRRAEQTAQRALEVIGQTTLAVQREEGFGFEWFEKDLHMPGPKGTPPDHRFIGEYMHNGYLLAIATRGRVWQTLIERAMDLATDYENETINAFVASHSPTIETAVPEPNTFPRLQLADLCIYTVEVSDDGKAQIVSAEYRACPAVEA